MKRDTVKAAEAVGKSGAAMNALGTGQLSLEEAAAISEFSVISTRRDGSLPQVGAAG